MKEKAQMNSDEFLAAMESIAPLAKDALVKRLTYECMFTMGYTVAPTKKLAGSFVLSIFSQLSTDAAWIQNRRQKVVHKGLYVCASYRI